MEIYQYKLILDPFVLELFLFSIFSFFLCALCVLCGFLSQADATELNRKYSYNQKYRIEHKYILLGAFCES
jgi:hypothetical protein